ncbi:prostate and testis expressed protein 14-like [Loxodonta africana]|uniref:prostate and testis expressed protein 14-like n=1 Tax=Loxodonta africana TaxID=9785 RepID=UPI0030CAAA0A
MDKRLLLPMLGLSLLLGFLQALQCHRCYVTEEDGSCQTERTTCEAKNGMVCFLAKHYIGKKFLFGFQDCRHLCKNVTSPRIAFRISISCCKNESFCNKF